MAGRREEKREDLKARLIYAARNRIADHGLANLRARDITQDAGCALGGFTRSLLTSASSSFM